jgi:hypothetical protein
MDLTIKEAVKNLETEEWESIVITDDIKTPKVKKIDNCFIFDYETKKPFYSRISEIEQEICSFLYKNSFSFFKGKKFSMERINSSLIPSIEISEKGTCSMEIDFSSDVECYDIVGEKTDLQDLGNTITAVLKVSKITFKKDLFKINYLVIKAKTSKIEKQNVNFDQQEIKQEEEPILERIENPIQEESEGSFF